MPAAKSAKISPLDPTAAAPFYRQIYDRFRDAIASGMLKPGDRIPSARALTKELGLARGTIETAYSLLAAEGYIEARGQAGTIVSPDLKPRTPIASPVPLPNSPHRRRQFSSGFHPAVPDGFACPGCVSPEDLGAPWRAQCARHAAF